MKAHLVMSDTALASQKACTAICGTEIAKADLCYFWDETEMGRLLAAPRGICRYCAESLNDGRNRMYVYGVKEWEKSE